MGKKEDEGRGSGTIALPTQRAIVSVEIHTYESGGSMMAAEKDRKGKGRIWGSRKLGT